MSAEAAQEAADNQASRTEQLRASTPSEGARASTPSEGASHGHGHGHGAAGSSESSSDGHAHGHDADGNCLEGGHSHGDGGTDSMAKTLGGGSGKLAEHAGPALPAAGGEEAASWPPPRGAPRHGVRAPYPWSMANCLLRLRINRALRIRLLPCCMINS